MNGGLVNDKEPFESCCFLQSRSTITLMINTKKNMTQTYEVPMVVCQVVAVKLAASDLPICSVQLTVRRCVLVCVH